MTTPENENAPAAGTVRGVGSRSSKGRRVDSSAAPRKRRDFKAVAAASLHNAAAVLAHWLPGGVLKGREYVVTNPTRNDGKAGSFSVNIVTGAWADFATGAKGGDFVALVAMLDGCSNCESHDRLWLFNGLDSLAPAPAMRATPARAADAGELVTPIPDDAPEPPRKHGRLGEPSQVWTYRDTQGRTLSHVARFDPADGKQVLPLTLWRIGGALRWQWKGIPEPRPLYGLGRLAARESVPVVICEGEKDSDAAALLLPGLVSITSSNGSRSANKADWSPLRGRAVLIWPDADEAGATYAQDVAKLATAAGVASVALLSVQALADLRGAALPAGWGAADALAEGITADALAALADGAMKAQAVESKASTAAPANARGTQKKAAPAAEGKRSPFALITADIAKGRRPGVYYVPTGTDKQTGEPVELPPVWICSPLNVDALTRDAAGAEWGRLLVFPDRDGVEHRWAMPCAMLGRDGAELREALLSQGLEITADPNHRRRLVEYIQAAEPGCFARAVTRAGWHGDAFVLPAGAIAAGEGEALVFQSAAPDSAKVAEAGTLAEWQALVSAPCAGNTRLVLALSAAFAAPCLHLVGLEGGGIHLRGASSCGKSTALAVAASVYGSPDYRREWRATDNALESVAAMHSDALLPLDEIGQLDPKHAASVAYLLSNGQGKSRSKRDGSLRAPATWRLLFLSNGEVGLGDLIADAGGKQRAGMEVRVVDLAADAGAGLGLFERVPAGVAAGAFADALKAGAALSYGTAFPAFLRSVVADLDRARRFLRSGMDTLAAELVGDDAAGQVRRVAQRFALIAAAGELATAKGVTGWAQGEAERAGRACFAAWLTARGGAGESEPRAMIRQVQAFIGPHSEGRFTPMDRINDDHAPRTLNRAGWRVCAALGEGVEHWVLPEVFRREVCAGFDAVTVARVLAARELLKTDGKGYTRRERIKGGEMVRVYRLLPGLLECEP